MPTSVSFRSQSPTVASRMPSLSTAVPSSTVSISNGNPEVRFPGCRANATSARDGIRRRSRRSPTTLHALTIQRSELTLAPSAWRIMIPLDGGVIARYMRALIASGDHSTALQRARTYKTRLRDELDLPPDRAVVELVAELRRNAQVKARAVEAPSTSAEESAAPAAVPVVAQEVVSAPVIDPVPSQLRARRWRSAAWLSAAAAIAFAAITTRVAGSRAASARSATR